MGFRFKWERISAADAERLITECGLDETEANILRLRRKGIYTPAEVAQRVNYSRKQMYEISKKVLAKIQDKL